MNKDPKITGYRELSKTEIDLINEGKSIAEQCRVYMEKLEANQDNDKRCLALGKTNLQQGFMWAIRAIARPESF